ncbi:MAG: Mur ligase family protein, partial [Wenzhouxiangella sp.]
MPGTAVDLFYVAGRYFATVERPPSGEVVMGERGALPGHVVRETDRIAGMFDLGCMSITLIRDGGEDAGQWSVVDVDFAPRLDRIPDPALLESAAERFMAWLFPAGSAGRIPIAAVTGTNGKTTTAFMLERILRESGKATGLACSTGSFVSGRPVSQFEDGYLPGHLTVLDNRVVEAAVLETTRGGALTTGIGFDSCEVAACLNVAADHLDPGMGIATVAQLAAVKRWIVERARRAVLNADDSRCLEMAESVRGRLVTLVSLELPARTLLAMAGAEGAACVIESSADGDWIVLYEGETRVPVVAVDAIPTAFGGRAVHNVSNAMHAVAMAHALGVEPRFMAAGLAAVDPDAESLPARLNPYRVNGMDILVDYAHNPHALARLVQFTDRWEVGGRRIIALSLPADRGDDFLLEGVAEVAGHFDLYVCKNYRI